MAAVKQDECEFLGWALIDLDEPPAKARLQARKRLGVQVEDIIDEAIKEKMDRMSEP